MGTECRPISLTWAERVCRFAVLTQKTNAEDYVFKNLKKITKNRNNFMPYSIRRAPCERNKFMMDTLGIMGGGERKTLLKGIHVMRGGATEKDIMNYLRRLDETPFFSNVYLRSPLQIGNDLFLVSIARSYACRSWGDKKMKIIYKNKKQITEYKY